MIGMLKGRITAKRDNRLLLDVAGVVYEVHLPLAIAKALEGKGCGEEVEIVTMCIFQVEQSRVVPFLIGFENEMQREFFERLLSVPKLGPRGALSLYCVPMPTLASAIEQGNVNFLKSLPGVGRQRARDIVAALQGRMAKFAVGQRAIEEAEVARPSQPDMNAIMKEAMEILSQLGYKRKEAKEMLKRAIEYKPNVTDAEELIKAVYELQRRSEGKGTA